MNIPQPNGAEIINLPRLALSAYRGSDDHGREGHWFSTDKAHAGYFGAVEEYELCDIDVIVLDASAHPALAQGGEDADDALFELIEENGAEMAVLYNWEGKGVVIYSVDGVAL